MSELYKRLSDLCEKKGISGYKLCKDCGISPSMMTDLKSGRKKTLNAENAYRIASYFNVSVAYLLGTEKENAPTKADKDVQEIIETLRHLDSDQREMVRAFVKTLKEMT